MQGHGAARREEDRSLGRLCARSSCSQMNRRLISILLVAAGSAWAETPTGRWDATITIGTLKVPFAMEFQGDGAAFGGTIVNGDERIRSAAGSFDGKRMSLRF